MGKGIYATDMDSLPFYSVVGNPMKLYVYSYQEAKRILASKTTRNRDWCKVHSQWRLYERNGFVELRWDRYPKTPFAYIDDDNIIEFVFPTQAYNDNHASITQHMEKVLPFMSFRKGVSDKRIAHMASIPGGRGARWSFVPYNIYHEVVRYGARYEQGIKFNMNTGRCLNRPTDYRWRTNPDKRKEWLAVIRNYRKNLKIARRLGLVDRAIEDYAASGHAHWVRYDNRAMHVRKLLQIMQQDMLRPKDLNYILTNTKLSYSRVGWPKVFDRMPNTHSEELRREFGALENTEK